MSGRRHNPADILAGLHSIHDDKKPSSSVGDRSMRLLHSVMPELKHAAIIAMVPLAAVLIAGCGALDSRRRG